MSGRGIGRLTVLLAGFFIAALGLAGCGGGGGGGGGGTSPITRVGGVQGDGDSDLGVALSGSGRHVAFSSFATNLVPDDTNGAYDVFVYDRQTGTTTRASVGPGAVPLQGNGGSFFPSISSDGRYVVFESDAANLLPAGPGEDGNLQSDIFVRDRDFNETTRVSVADAGFPADLGNPNDDSFKPSISADGNFVVFYSLATNLVPGDNNGVTDVFVYDRAAGTAERVSVDGAGAEGNGSSAVFGQAISNNGNLVAFESLATNLAAGDANGFRDVFVRDLSAGTTALASLGGGGIQGDGESRVSAISGNGQFVVFESDATNLVPNDNNGVTDIFVRDLVSGTTTRVSVSSTGEQANGASFALGSTTISDDGQFVVFESDATNLVAGDTNGVPDVFVRDLVNGTTSRLSITSSNGQPATESFEGAISRDGTVATFGSYGTEFVSDNPSGFTNVYLVAVP